MSATFIIPLAAPPQAFTCSLNGVTYRLTVIWRNAAPGWFLDIADDQGDLIVGGIPLVTGADLLAQYEYLGIGGQLVVASSSDVDAPPTFAGLGTATLLYYVAP